MGIPAAFTNRGIILVQIITTIMMKPIAVGIVPLIWFGNMLPVPDGFIEIDVEIDVDGCVISEGLSDGNDEPIAISFLQILPTGGRLI